MESWNQIDAESEDVAHGEGPSGCGEDICELDIELAVVVIDPAAGDDAGVDPVKSDDVGCAEKSIGHQTQHSRNSVLSKDVKCVIDSYIVFH